MGVSLACSDTFEDDRGKKDRFSKIQMRVEYIFIIKVSPSTFY